MAGNSGLEDGTPIGVQRDGMHSEDRDGTPGAKAGVNPGSYERFLFKTCGAPRVKTWLYPASAIWLAKLEHLALYFANEFAYGAVVRIAAPSHRVGSKLSGARATVIGPTLGPLGNRTRSIRSNRDGGFADRRYS